jgi:hypothetical protein
VNDLDQMPVKAERRRADWAAPDDQLLAVVNDRERPIGTYLYGRRMYETMVSWAVCQRCAGIPGVIGLARLERAAGPPKESPCLVGQQQVRV